MLDLPLREGDRPPASEPKRPAAPPPRPPDGGERRSASPTVRVEPRHRHRRRGGSRWPLWLVLMLAAAALVWWLLPNAAVITPSVAMLELPPQRVGGSAEPAEVFLTNTGERALVVRELQFVGEAAGDFQVDGANCLERRLAQDENCRLLVTFAPVTRGLRAVALEIAGKAGNSPLALPVSGTAQAPQVGLAPARLDFGGAPVDGDEVAVDLTISSIGTLPLKLGRVRITGEHASEFRRAKRCPRTTLEPGKACTFAVEFAPRVAGPRRAVLSIASDAPEGTAEVELVGVGLWDGPVLAADRETIDFGEQLRGTRSATRSVRLRNPMPGPVTVSAVTLSGEAFELSRGGCEGQTLGPAESCSVGVVFAPAAEESVRGAVTIRASESEEPVTIGLAGHGVQPRLAAETGELSFGSTRAGLRSGSQQAVFTNSGSGTLRLARVEVRGDGSSSFAVREDGCSKQGLAPESKCSVEVAFQPQKAGATGARLAVVPEEGSEPVEVSMSGRGVVAGLAVDRGRLDFGAVYRTRFEDRVLTMSNAGSASLSIRGLRIQGAAADDYNLVAVGCRLDIGLAPRKSCKVSIRFTPTADGRRRAKLVIEHNGPKNPAEIDITGQGLAPVPVFEASASRFEFGALPQGGSSQIETLTLSNQGAGWLDLKRVVVRGDQAEDFRIVPGTCDGTTALAPGGSCTIGLRFTAQAAGRRQAFVLIEHGASGSPARVILSGEGAL